MKKNILWLLLFVPALFVAASSPIENKNEVADEFTNAPCSEYGEVHLNWDGNSGCGYVFDFSSSIGSGCSLASIDLDPSSPTTIESFWEDDHVRLYVTNGTGSDGKITMYPKPGYQIGGFLNSCDVNLNFSDGTYEYCLWKAYVDNYAGPYPIACY